MFKYSSKRRAVACAGLSAHGVLHRPLSAEDSGHYSIDVVAV